MKQQVVYNLEEFATKYHLYNPQNEMFRHRKTKCFICKTKRI